LLDDYSKAENQEQIQIILNDYGLLWYLIFKNIAIAMAETIGIAQKL
jgi:hypothetical protein